MWRARCGLGDLETAFGFVVEKPKAQQREVTRAKSHSPPWATIPVQAIALMSSPAGLLEG